jgi:hypothetical protein
MRKKEKRKKKRERERDKKGLVVVGKGKRRERKGKEGRIYFCPNDWIQKINLNPAIGWCQIEQLPRAPF